MEPTTLPSGYTLHGRAYDYIIEKVLGQGSLGITYKAKIKLSGSLGNLESSFYVAIKELFVMNLNERQGTDVETIGNSLLNNDYREAFIQEGINISKLSSPHIVKVLEAFDANNTSYLSMEYIDGENLDEYIQRNDGLNEREALENALQISDALSYMHNSMILHLDVKPLNIMRRNDGNLVLIDFGQSRQFTSDGVLESTDKIGIGTSGYSPMESAYYRKEDGFLPALDIYALGATLYRMLTGIMPPDASSVYNHGFPESSMRKRGICLDIISLVSWLMQPMQQMRPQSISEVIKEIYRLLPSCSNKKSVDNAPQLYDRPADSVNNPDSLENCNGFQICWGKDVPNTKKSVIRALLKDMKKIGEQDKFQISEYGETWPVTEVPIMSLGDKTWGYLYKLSTDITSKYHHNASIGTILDAINELSKWTSLQFRLSNEDEIRFIHTAELGDDHPILCYSKDGRLLSKKFGSQVYAEEIDIAHGYFSKFRVHAVCDGVKPIINATGYNIEPTQYFVDEIVPIGFGMYKIRRNNQWNITRPESPLFLMLSEDFDSITHVSVWHVPGPGPWSGYDYLGIEAVKNNLTSFYAFEKGKFKLLSVMSKEEIKFQSELT